MYEFLIAIFAGAFILGIGFFASLFIALRIKRMDNEHCEIMAELQIQYLEENTKQQKIVSEREFIQIQHVEKMEGLAE